MRLGFGRQHPNFRSSRRADAIRLGRAGLARPSSSPRVGFCVSGLVAGAGPSYAESPRTELDVAGRKEDFECG